MTPVTYGNKETNAHIKEKLQNSSRCLCGSTSTLSSNHILIAATWSVGYSRWPTLLRPAVVYAAPLRLEIRQFAPYSIVTELPRHQHTQIMVRATIGSMPQRLHLAPTTSIALVSLRPCSPGTITTSAIGACSRALVILRLAFHSLPTLVEPALSHALRARRHTTFHATLQQTMEMA